VLALPWIASAPGGTRLVAAPVEGEPPGVRAAPGWDLLAATNVPSFQLELSQAALSSLREQPREWTRGTLRLGDEVFTDVGVHIKGSEGSLQPIDRRPSLTISINKYVPGRKLHGLRKIHFNNTAEDPTFMTEILCGQICRQAGLPAARSGYATLTLNRRKLGLYVLKEGLTKEFLAQHFQRTDGNLYDGGFQKDIDHELERIGGDGPEDQSDRLALLAAAREPDPQRRWLRLQKVLDTDRFMTLLAFTTIAWNWDGYPMARNNYRLYHDPESDRLVFIPHGLDQMFWQPQGSIDPRMNGIVAAAVLRIPECRRLYRERLALLHTNVFQVDQLSRRIDQLAAVIRPYKPDTDTQADRLKRQIAGRAESIARQLGAPEPAAPAFVGNVAPLRGWVRSAADRLATLDEARVEPGLRILRIRHTNDTASTWMTRIRLPGGTYEFAGRAKVPRLQTAPGNRNAGAALRTSTPAVVSSRRLQASADWAELRCRFSIRSPEEPVELVCELRGSDGEAWFDLESLRLERLPANSGSSWLNLFR
jgi:hypothetical protein